MNFLLMTNHSSSKHKFHCFVIAQFLSQYYTTQADVFAKNYKIGRTW